ncbi:MAG: hypothetical protein PHO62_07745 [Sulfurimonas sp.]|uniref:hypothetical protein n=1 Tax=Sulfurimonas sp. TaxID=2022749 RepID=UPI002618ACF6|nr:hypothetical protein [Sulfurimonas sp.]MDD5373299.1 hypothetical protein [Sulfurimonas sp.]
MSNFSFFIIVSVLILFGGCAKEVIPTSVKPIVEKEKPKREITEAFGKKFGFNAKEDARERELFEYGYNFFKKEK